MAQQKQPTLPPQTALITESVPNLIGGVSQKADTERRRNETETILNGLLSPAEGLKKRPPSQFKYWYNRGGSPTTLAAGGVFTHLINRSDTEQYAVVCMDHDLLVNDLLSGATKTVTYPDGKAYINSDTPGKSYRAVTIGDYTFIVNKEKTTASLSSPLSTTDLYEALVWLQVGDYGVNYSVTLDGETIRFPANSQYRDEVTTEFLARALFNRIPRGCHFTIFDLGTTDYVIGDTVTITQTTGGSTAFVYTVKAGLDGNVESRHSIARELAYMMNADADGLYGDNNGNAIATEDPQLFGAGGSGLLWCGTTTGDVFDFSIATDGACTPSKTTDTSDHDYDCILNGSTIYIVAADASDFTIEAHDGLGDESIRAIKGKVQSFNDLPSRAIDGFKVEVVGEDRQSSFFVQYDDSGTADTDGIWQETLKGGERTSLDPATMPHILVRQSDGTFVFSEADWDARLVGKLATGSDPMPSFVGKKLNDVGFYKNRLAVVDEEDDFTLTSVGNYFNFFRLSVQQLLDDDLIDKSVNVTDGRSINFLSEFDSDMLLWGDKKQYQLQGSKDLGLTPRTASAPAVTAFDNSSKVRPVQVGKNVFFCAEQGTSSTKVYEFYRDASGNTSDALDISEDTPSFCMGSPIAFTGSETLKMLALVNDFNRNRIYVYNYARNGDQLTQSAWSSWQFDNTLIQSANFIKNRLVLVAQRGTETFLETISIQPDDVDGSQASLTYLDCRFDNATSGVSAAYATGVTTWTLPFNLPDNGILWVARKVPSGGTDLVGGQVFTRPALNKIATTGDYHLVSVWIGFLFDFRIVPSILYKREQEVAQADVKTIVQRLNLRYTKSGYFMVSVTPQGRSSAYTYSKDDASSVLEGVLTVPIQADNEHVSIYISNSSHRPSCFLGFTWDALISQKTRR